MHKDLYFGVNGDIHASVWEPEGEPKAVVQIVHGIAEYALRYRDFAEFLVDHGFLVVAEDHMGHGKSISDRCPQGCFSGGWFAAVADTYALLKDTMNRYPGIPYILFGHSMGSFMVRTILQEYPDSGIAGCVICGTGWMPEVVLKAGRMISKLVCKKCGETKPNDTLQKLVFGGYNKKICEPRTNYDWLSCDQKQVDAYVADPLCGFDASAGLIRDMLTGILHIQKKENLDKMRKALPVYFIAGDEDPVGDYGKGVLKAADRFRAVGMEAVSCQLFKGCRHEILNEINNKDIYNDILSWMSSLLK